MVKIKHKYCISTTSHGLLSVFFKHRSLLPVYIEKNQGQHVHISATLAAFQIRTHELKLRDSMKCLSDRSSCPEVFCKKGVLENFAKFTGKHLYQSQRSTCNFIKKRGSATGVFLWILRNFSEHLFIEDLQWLLLQRQKGPLMNKIWIYRRFSLMWEKEVAFMKIKDWLRILYIIAHQSYRYEKMF